MGIYCCSEVRGLFYGISWNSILTHHYLFVKTFSDSVTPSVLFAALSRSFCLFLSVIFVYSWSHMISNSNF